MEKDKNISFPLGEKNAFEMDLADYRSDYHQLINKRNLSDSDTSDIESWIGKPITESSISACLKYFYADAPIGLLSYFFEEDILKVWFLNHNGMQFQGESTITEKELGKLGEDLSKGLKLKRHEQTRIPRERGLGLDLEEDTEEALDLDQVIQSLSDLLFPEGLSQRLLLQEIEHLIIIPALNLQQLPFSILKPFDDETLFIDKWSYSIASSIYDIAKLTLRKKTKESGAVKLVDLDKDALLVGNPIFSSLGKWVLPPLPGAEEEVKTISDFLSIHAEQVLIGEHAILPTVKKKAREVSILYFATHGVADPANPLDGSGLFFTPTADNPQGFWTAREIQEEDFSAILVILSACQTGLGQSHDAGVIGLSRAFHLAGAENIIMSLWSVDDHATNSLMKIFMKKIQERHKFFPSEPLRQAMLEYRQENPGASPIFWASFSTMGIPY